MLMSSKHVLSLVKRYEQRGGHGQSFSEQHTSSPVIGLTSSGTANTVRHLSSSTLGLLSIPRRTYSDKAFPNLTPSRSASARVTDRMSS